MTGYCDPPDTVINEHVWGYSPNKGFYNCTDNNFSHHASPVMPFLKKMANKYPNYNFCGIVHASPGQQAHDVLCEQRHLECLTNQINAVKDKGGFGGAILMYGFPEGQYRPNSDSIQKDIEELIKFVRVQTECKKLPIILGRYEENSDGSKDPKYCWDKKAMIKCINDMPIKVLGLRLTPFKSIPAKDYCDSHHYNTEGYDIWTSDAVNIILKASDI
jgi:hypothetical protein